MRAVQIDAPGGLRLVDLPMVTPKDDEAVVAVAFAGICGSDMEVLCGTRPSTRVRYPIRPGHEWSGTVSDVGVGGDRGLLGQKVVGEGFGSCHRCRPCRAGAAHLCAERYDEIGFTRAGAWAEYLVIPAKQLHVLAPDAELRSAAGLEPAACAAEAVRRGGVEDGARLAVLGAGALGCLVVQLAVAAGASTVITVEPNTERAAMAVRCGASAAVTPEEAGGLAHEFDVVIEAARSPLASAQALSLVGRGGRVVLMGMPSADASLSVLELVTRQITIAPVFGASSRAWSEAVAAFGRGVLDPGILVSHVFSLAEVERALQVAARSEGAVGKVLLTP